MAVLTRALNRGEPVKATDLVTERRPATRSPPTRNPAQPRFWARSPSTRSRLALCSGSPIPPRPRLVTRGESVTIVYETPSISLSMRGLANEGGRMGAVVNVVNVASKKILQATVIGPGRVSVSPGPAAQQGAGTAPVQATASLR
ncbi:flagellar basal body P-ring formation chaperone FlgA [Methylobacterium sp. P31]